MFGPGFHDRGGKTMSEWWPGINESKQGMPPTVEVLEEPAALTPDGLADQVHQICSSNKVVFYPNNIDTALEERDYDFIASKTTLVIVKPCIGATPTRFSQDVLSKLKHKKSIRSVHFHPNCRGCETSDQVPFDLALFSKQLRDHLPNVEMLTLRCMNFINFRLESTSIKKLKLKDPKFKDGIWEVSCPNLEEFQMANHTPPVKNLARALVNSPLIKRFYSHKYWNEETIPRLYLPNCQSFTFRRGDGTDSLKLYLPRVKELILDACYKMRKCDLLTEGHPSHAEWNLAPEERGTSFKLSLKNAGLSKSAISTLKKSGRVLNPDALKQRKDFSHGPDAAQVSLKKYMAQASKDLAGASIEEQMEYAVMMHNLAIDARCDDADEEETTEGPRGLRFEWIEVPLDPSSEDDEETTEEESDDDRGDEKPGAHSNADVAVSNRYVNDQRTCQSDTQKKTGAPKKAEAQEKCGKPGVSWAASGFLIRKHPARKNTP